MVVAVAVVVALVGVGTWGQVQGWWPWADPTDGPTSTAGPGPRPSTPDVAQVLPGPGTETELPQDGEVAEGSCLSLDAATLFYDELRPADWASTSTDCEYGNVVIDQVLSDDEVVDCDDTTGCWMFSEGGFTYLAHTLPAVGTCFYGFLNTAYPERGSRSANADLLHTAACGEYFPPLDAEQAAITYDLEVSDLAPVEFAIVDLLDEGAVGTSASCPDGSSPWRGITYIPGVKMTVCSIVSYEAGD